MQTDVKSQKVANRVNTFMDVNHIYRCNKLNIDNFVAQNYKGALIFINHQEEHSCFILESIIYSTYQT